jgi:anti-sigma B factor antagonist
MELHQYTIAPPGVTVIEVSGEIDLMAGPQLREELLPLTQTEAPHLILDLKEVSFVDSTGIGVLVGALKRARENGGALAYCSVQPRVYRVLQITGLLQALPLYGDVAEATAALYGQEAINDS